jgi:hypothetical protein
MSKFKIFTVTVGLAFATAASSGHFGFQVHAEQTSFFVFGVTGIIPGETARLNVVSVGVRDTISAQLISFDGQGSILVQSAVELAPGRAVSLVRPSSGAPQGTASLLSHRQPLVETGQGRICAPHS